MTASFITCSPALAHSGAAADALGAASARLSTRTATPTTAAATRPAAS